MEKQCVIVQASGVRGYFRCGCISQTLRKMISFHPSLSWRHREKILSQILLLEGCSFSREMATEAKPSGHSCSKPLSSADLGSSSIPLHWKRAENQSQGSSGKIMNPLFFTKRQSRPRKKRPGLWGDWVRILVPPFGSYWLWESSLNCLCLYVSSVKWGY